MAYKTRKAGILYTNDEFIRYKKTMAITIIEPFLMI